MNVRFQGVNQIIRNLREASVATIDAQQFPEHQASFEGVAEGRLAAAVEDPDFFTFTRLGNGVLDLPVAHLTLYGNASAPSLNHTWENYSNTFVPAAAKTQAFQKFSELFLNAGSKISYMFNIQGLLDALKAKLP